MDFPKPERTAEPYSLSNDPFGYAVYSLVLFASQAQQAAVQAVRDAVNVWRSMLPAHVTAKGPVCAIPSIEELQSAIDEQVRAVKPFEVKFSGERRALTSQNGENFGFVAIEVTPELADLHRRLLNVVNPISISAYGLDNQGVFRPHLTVFHEPEPGLEDLGAGLLRELEIGNGFEATSVSLMGHIGTPHRGKWTSISEHRFGA